MAASDLGDIASLGFGLGLREPHYRQVLDQRPGSVDWFEIISENFMEMHGGYVAMLQDIRQDYPLVMHGVALSIGSTDPLDKEYLQKLFTLAEAIQPAMISDHLCFTGVEGLNSHDLLPVPLTEEALQHISERVKEVQEYLGRRLFLENPSTYLEFAQSNIPEWEFLARLVEDTGCGLLLDVNNIYVSSANHGFDPCDYLEAIPADAIGYIHLAGHSEKPDYLFDTHDQPVAESVWELYAETLTRKGFRNTMVEWDANIPEFSVLEDHLQYARRMAESALERNNLLQGAC